MAAAENRFDALYRAHADAIRGYCLRRLGARDAFDAAADVFVVVWQKIDQCPAGDEAKLWIYGIARNVVANRRRKATRWRTLVERIITRRRRCRGLNPSSCGAASTRSSKRR